MSDETAFLAEFKDKPLFETLYELTQKELEKIQNETKKGSDFEEIRSLADTEKIVQNHLKFMFGQNDNNLLKVVSHEISNTASCFISLNYTSLRMQGVPPDAALIAAQNEFINDAYLAAQNKDIRQKYSPEILDMLKEPIGTLMKVSQEFKINFSYKPEDFAAFLIKNLYRSLRETYPEHKSALYTNLETLNKRFSS